MMSMNTVLTADNISIDCEMRKDEETSHDKK